jgi:mannose-6-phosphate isomerase-like protein (cupin superfamily)
MTTYSTADMQKRLVRYAELRPCTTAFIDTRTPGSEHKENFTIIGPGVAENPDQYVHIDIPHGFNIGGARQPPRCVNSQHSHETAEVFIVHTGVWRFKTGERGSDGFVDLYPGDTISIPTQLFRGFENVGSGKGFLFAVLGGDDPGRVTWAPYVFESARKYGLVLLENGRLIDTTREAIPADTRPMPPTTATDVARLKVCSSEEIARCTVRFSDLTTGGGLSAVAGFSECPIVGPANPSEGMPAGRMSWAHGFQVRALLVEPGSRTPLLWRDEEEVLLGHSGELRVSWDGGALALGPGDTFTVPKGLPHSIANESALPAVAFVVRGTDHPHAAHRLDG